MTAQHEKHDAPIIKRTAFTWPRDLVEPMSFWGDLDWPRRVFGSAVDTLRIEEAIEGDAMIVRAEIPGVDPDKDVDISVDDGVLTITAKRESTTEETKDGGFRSEFRYGSFVRQIRMPKTADLDALTASYDAGVIEVKVPLRAEKVPTARKVEITRS